MLDIFCTLVLDLQLFLPFMLGSCVGKLKESVISSHIAKTSNITLTSSEQEFFSPYIQL